MNTNPEYVRHVLRDAVNEVGEWSVQGMGMLRRYLPAFVDGRVIAGRTRRVHIWHSDLQVRGVSLMHTHPWNMVSEIHSGQLTNARYVEVSDQSLAEQIFSGAYNAEELRHIFENEGGFYWRQDLRPGPGGGLLAEPQLVQLQIGQMDYLVAGDQYKQTKNEIHSSHPYDYCVTIVDRVVPLGGDPDHAYTFWRMEDGQDGWVSAEPRPATVAEVEKYTLGALEAWDA